MALRIYGIDNSYNECDLKVKFSNLGYKKIKKAKSPFYFGDFLLGEILMKMIESVLTPTSPCI